MQRKRLIFLILFGSAFCCPLAASADDQVRIEWSKDTLTLVEHGAGYGRIIRLKNGDILCCFNKERKVWVKMSVDEGRSWNIGPVLVAKSDFGAVTNPELLELRDGSIMCCLNERPTDGVHQFAILVCSSTDGGRKWSKPRYLYKADTKFENGCWEPAAIQLPGGEIQLFFANENPYRTSPEQEITMLRSSDNGRTWKKPTTVSFRKDHRDGMPVPLLLRDGPKGIVVAIEDNGLGKGFQPVIVYSSLGNNWRAGPVSADSPHRWPALNVPLKSSLPGFSDPRTSTGAPYIRQMLSGETILSFQFNEADRSKPHMVVCIGDNWCRNFASLSVPFEVDANTACMWNSLFVKSKDVITAVSGTSINRVEGLWTIDGSLVRESAPADRSAKRKSEIMSVWQHRVDDGPAVFHVLYSNGAINNPNGKATWTVRGKELTMRWPSDKAKGGAWVDRCVLSPDGTSYSGTNQNGIKLTGRLSQKSPSGQSR